MRCDPIVNLDYSCLVAQGGLSIRRGGRPIMPHQVRSPSGRSRPPGASEYGNLEAAALLLDRGADVNARATVDAAGVGGHTATFHAVTQFDDGGLPVAQLLIERGADLAVRAKLPGTYDRPGEIVECTALGYALQFGGRPERRTVTLLRERGAIE